MILQPVWADDRPMKYDPIRAMKWRRTLRRRARRKKRVNVKGGRSDG